MSATSSIAPTTLEHLRKKYVAGEKLAMLTCYDASFAALEYAAGVDIQLIGDSLGMVLQGHHHTLAVTLQDVAYHVAAVRRGAPLAFVVGDMPFGTFQVSPAATMTAAVELMAAGSNMVKLEGGETMAETVRFLVDRGVPVCGHLGLTPQSVNTLGGYRIQGRTEAAIAKLIADARCLRDAGAAMIVLELMPATTAATVTQAIDIPTIGIGAGADCSGQVLVLHDMLDIYPGKKARFVKNFMVGVNRIDAAISEYVRAVKAKEFPAAEHSYV
jgi:3-methyl-2-oxobutanoate hydroxymethyltransferase